MYNILICDDEQDIVNALKIYLSGGDYCLFEASNGREALEVVEKNDIHLILMDIMMPVMDGMEATQHIRDLKREDAASIPIIAMTAQTTADIRETCRKAGMDAYIAKPIREEELAKVIRKSWKVKKCNALR